MKDHLDEKLKRFQPGTLCYLDRLMLGLPQVYRANHGYIRNLNNQPTEVSGAFLLLSIESDEKLLNIVGLWGESIYHVAFWWPVYSIWLYEEFQVFLEE